jgi:hypothetical protein
MWSSNQAFQEHLGMMQLSLLAIEEACGDDNEACIDDAMMMMQHSSMARVWRINQTFQSP